MTTRNLLWTLALTLPLAFACTRRNTTPDNDTQPTATGATEAINPGNVENTDNSRTGFGTTSEESRYNSIPQNTGRMGNGVSADAGGAVSSDVYLRAQSALRDRGYTVSSGPMGGPETTRAIQQFQRERDLPVTGTFTTATLRELNIPVSSDRAPASVPDDNLEEDVD